MGDRYIVNNVLVLFALLRPNHFQALSLPSGLIELLYCHHLNCELSIKEANIKKSKLFTGIVYIIFWMLLLYQQVSN